MDILNDRSILYAASGFFLVAIVHTFMANKILQLAHRFEEGSIAENLLHFMGEVEVVFGFWAFIFIAYLSFKLGTPTAVDYVNGVNFTEAAFVFVIMCMASTKPIIYFSQLTLESLARLLPFSKSLSFYLVALSVGPLLGSFITEPAAMTILALILKERFYDRSQNVRFKYASLGLLFVNVSIGGTLTHFAAPPVIMVATPWAWDTAYMSQHFGWKAAIAILIGTAVTSWVFRSELNSISSPASPQTAQGRRIPLWLIASHFIFMGFTVLYHAYASFFLGLFLIFLGWTEVTKEYQDPLKIRESLLVGFFLGGLVTLGGLQGWWISPLLSQLSDLNIYFGATILTSVTDNAAITYLATLVPDLSEKAKYAVVAGAVTGGGLTVIANAPNPAGYGILRDSFGDNGISPLGLLLGALPYTVLAAIAFLCL